MADKLMLLQESTQTHSTCEHWRKYLELILVFESGSRLELVNSNLLNLNKRRREKSYMSAPTATPSASALQQRIFQQNLRHCSGIPASTALISAGAMPVNVRLCFGRLKPGPTGLRSSTGTPMDGLRCRTKGSVGFEAMITAVEKELALQQWRLEFTSQPRRILLYQVAKLHEGQPR